MAQKIIHKRSSALDKIPEASQLEYGEIAVNFASGATSGDPTAFLAIKKTDGNVVQIHEDKYFQDQIDNHKHYLEDIIPQSAHTYENVKYTTNSLSGATFFFGTLKPDVYGEPVTLRFRITATAPENTDYYSQAEGSLTIIKNSLVTYASYNALSGTGASALTRGICVNRASETIAESNGHFVGVSLSAATYTSALNKTIVVEIYDVERGTFEFIDPMLTYNEATAITTVSACTIINQYTNGLQESGDTDTKYTLDRVAVQSPLKKGTKTVYRQNIIFKSSDNAWYSLFTTASTATTKNGNTDIDVDPDSFLYYTSTGNTTSANIAANTCYRYYTSGESRYTTNLDSNLTAGLPLYVVMTKQDNGFYRLVSPIVTQTLPASNDGNFYKPVGFAVNTSAFTFSPFPGILYHDGTKLCLGEGNYMPIGNSGETDETVISYYGLRKLIENDEETISQALLRHNESAGFDQNGNSLLPGGTDLTTAILEISGRTVDLSAYYTSAETYTSGETNLQIDTAINALISGAPGTLDTLKEIADALSGDPDFAVHVWQALSGKQETLVSGTNIKTVGGNSLLGSGDVPFPKSDWEEDDTSSPSYIQNKPDIPTLTSDLINDSGFISSGSIATINGSALTEGGNITIPEPDLSDYLPIGSGLDPEGTVSYNGLLKQVENDEVVTAAALAQLNESCGFDPNGHSLLPSGISLTEAILSMKTNVLGIDVPLGSAITYSGVTLSESGVSVTDTIQSFFTEFINDEYTVSSSLNDLNTRSNGLDQRVTALENSSTEVEYHGEYYEGTLLGTLRIDGYNNYLYAPIPNVSGQIEEALEDYVPIAISGTNDPISAVSYYGLRNALIEDELVTSKSIIKMNESCGFDQNGNMTLSGYTTLTDAIEDVMDKKADITQIATINGSALTNGGNIIITGGGGGSGETNVITAITVNGTPVPPVNKVVGLSVPTSASIEASGFTKNAPTEASILASGFTKNAGTITGINMNGSSKGTSGVVDLGTVVTAQTQLSTASTGNGNVLTDLTVSNHQITMTKGMTIPTWATASTKPSYTASEVGALPTGTTLDNVGDGTTRKLSDYATNANFTAHTANTTVHVTSTEKGTWNGKQDAISDLTTIRNNAASGASAYTNAININNTLTAHTGNTAIHLPTVSASDNGKILMVSGGTWTLVTPVSIYTGSGTPAQNLGNDGDIYLQTS